MKFLRSLNHRYYLAAAVVLAGPAGIFLTTTGARAVENLGR